MPKEWGDHAAVHEDSTFLLNHIAEKADPASSSIRLAVQALVPPVDCSGFAPLMYDDSATGDEREPAPRPHRRGPYRPKRNGPPSGLRTTRLRRGFRSVVDGPPAEHCLTVMPAGPELTRPALA